MPQVHKFDKKVNVLTNVSVSNPSNVRQATLVHNGAIMSRVKPVNGKLEFWKDMYLNMDTLGYSYFHIELELEDTKTKCVVTIPHVKNPKKNSELPEVKTVNNCQWIPIMLPEKASVGTLKQMKKLGFPNHNNVFVCHDGSLTLRCAI